jgi:hypothetical protein
MNKHPTNSRDSAASGTIAGWCKRFSTLCSFLSLLLLTSCGSEPLVLSPIGPAHSTGGSYLTGVGRLQVFTETDEFEVDHDVPYFPHRDYQIYTADGKRLQRVWNAQNHEDETPTIVSLPAGRYEVRADAEFYGLVRVPVLIKPNQLTKVILQPGWKPQLTASANEVVSLPKGYAVGWSAQEK